MKISDAARLQAAGVDTGLVAQRATEAYLMQVGPQAPILCKVVWPSVQGRIVGLVWRVYWVLHCVVQ